MTAADLGKSFLGTCVAISLAGCASVSVLKVDNKTGKLVDGAAEGLRFYMPRPYISVFEPFIIASEVYLANGELSPDGNYVLLTQVPKGLESIVSATLQGDRQQSMGSIAVDATTVVARRSLLPGPQSAPASEDAKDEKKDAPKKDEPKKEEQAKDGGSAPAPGVLSYKAIVDNSAFAVTPQPRYFNVLWLPDFDEQYVVQAKAGLGNSGVVLTLGQGWSLQGLDAKIDNSAIAKPLLELYSGTLGALQKLATAKIQAPLAAIGGGPQSARAGDKSAKLEFKGGTPLTVKVTKVRIVAPGLYPILKPGEIAPAAADGSTDRRILRPSPPLTNIAFNTYDAVVIEAARSTGDTALRIHQYVDTTLPVAQAPVTPPAEAKPPQKAPAAAGAKAAENALNVALSNPAQITAKGEYYVASVTTTDVTKVVLRLRTDGKNGKLDKLPDESDTKKLVIAELKKSKLDVKVENVTIAK